MKMRTKLIVLIQILILLGTANVEQNPKVETHQFTTEVSRLMDILINSLYTQKQIFLREVISNASDALDKIRFISLTDDKALGDKKELEIRIQINEQNKYVSVKDTGVGMTKSEMIQNLGTIAKSGTTNFLSALKEGNINLIGQFGVGFYSTFLAGSKVQVISKSNNDIQHIWTSQTASSYNIIPDPDGNTLGRGTEVRVYLKEDSLDFLNHNRLERLIKKYSQFIDFPIFLKNKKQVQVDEQKPQTETDQDIEIKQKSEKQQAKKVKKTVYLWDRINADKALWLREKEDIYDEDYIDFFKVLSKQSNPPMNWIHFNTQGEVEFTSIIYIPNRVPFDFYTNYNTRKNQLKLYVRRVLIAEKHNQLVPKYLSFVTGVIDSDDLPLNVNRETLQHSKTFKIINQKITKKILDMVTDICKWEYVDEEEYEEDIEEQEEDATLTQEEIAEKKKKEKEEALAKNKNRYEQFYRQFGKAMKLGVIEDKNNRVKLASLTRWTSTKNTSELVSLDDYIKRMKPIQDQIYYFSGEDRGVLQKSPLVTGLVRKGYEVLLCDDPIDQYVFSVLREYQKKNLVNVGKGDFKMPDDDQFERKKQKFLLKKYQPFVTFAKKVLFDKVTDVTISNRLTTEPCVVVAGEYGHSSFMEKIQKAQMFGNNDAPPSAIKKSLEINPNHKLNQIILEKVKDGKADEQVEQLIELLYQTAAFHSGFSVSDSNDFAKRFYKTYSKAMGVLSRQRNELEVGDVELQEKDFEGENQQTMRINPSDIVVTPENVDE